MAQHDGHWIVDVSSYDAFRAEVINQGWDWDSTFGNQCWDLAQLLWWAVGRWVLQTGPHYAAAECWLVSRNVNSQNGTFQLIYDVNQIKRGDVVVFDRPYPSHTGHIAFADENYVAGKGYLRCLGENQGGTPFWRGGADANIANITLRPLGAFRYPQWQQVGPTPPPTPPPTPTPTPITPVGFIPKKSTYPWVTMWRYNDK